MCSTRGGLDITNGKLGVSPNYPLNIRHVDPKPTVWSGPHRLCKSDYWSKANSGNTALCLCKSSWIAFVDDRSVLSPTWLQAVREAMEGNYCVVGTYEKHENMRVENGEILEYGPITGTDHRRVIGRDRKPCIGTWLFGCTFALPLEWALQVNGFDENMDSLGQEDTQFGSMLDANGFDIRMDKRMHVIQDRTPGECGPEMKRTSKERFQHDTQDRGHEAIRRFYGKKQAGHVWNIREMRASVLSGNPFPNTDSFPRNDWWDGQPIAEFE